MTTPRGPSPPDYSQTPKSWPRRHKILTALGAIAALFIVSSIANAADVHGSGGTDSNNTSGNEQPVVAASASPTRTATATTAPRSGAVAPSHPHTAHKLPFPPRTLAEFRAFAATGDASQIHQVATRNVGLASCPQPEILVTVSRRPTVRTVQSDLAAFFLQRGLLNYCGSAVFAYHSRRDYRAHIGNGYTAGRVILAINTGSGPQRNLEVDVGSVFNIFKQVQFAFNF